MIAFHSKKAKSNHICGQQLWSHKQKCPSEKIYLAGVIIFEHCNKYFLSHSTVADNQSHHIFQCLRGFFLHQSDFRFGLMALKNIRKWLQLIFLTAFWGPPNFEPQKITLLLPYTPSVPISGYLL